MTLRTDQGTSLSAPEAIQQATEHYQAGRLSQAEALCQKLLLVVPNHAEALHLHAQICRQLDDKVRNAVKNFQITPSPATLDTLRALRRETLSILQQQSNDSLTALWASPFRDTHKLLMNSGLRNHLRTADEDTILEELRVDLAARQGDPAKPARLLTVMLLCHSCELPPPENLLTIPEWLREVYVDFLLEMPALHNRVGDADIYIDYLFRLVEVFHKAGISRHGIVDDPVVRELTYLFTIKANFLQTYFNTRNLRNLYAQRGDLISAALITAGNKTLTVLPPRIHPQGKIRLGIYAEHFHPKTETYFTLSHFEHLDRARFDITLYTERSTGHPLEQHCIAHADRFVVLPQTDIAGKVDRIRADDLDMLLISTNMTTVASTAAQLGTHRIARIQVASVSSPVTTGCRHVDVMLSAEWNEPEKDAADHYTEHLYLMPGSVNYYAYQYDKDPATVNVSRAKLGITDEQIAFFSGANFFKILPELSQAWVKIMASVPNSVLILMPFNPYWGQYQAMPFVERIKRQMSESGVDVSRLRVINSVPTRADVHKLLALTDIYLDAYPFAGACSMLDPIIVGIPAVARRGPVGRSNHAASLLRMIGLDELVADSEQQFIAAAVSMAKDRPQRQRIRERLLALKNAPIPPYFDIQVFSTRVGTALQDLYERYTALYRGLVNMSDTALRQQLQDLANSVVGTNFELNTLTDMGIIHALIEPFFRHHHGGHHHHMVDVGACYGHMAAPFLAAGWSADLFEPDPGARQMLEKNLSSFGQRCRVFAAAISNAATDKVVFHKSISHGLSGLGDSPFGSTESVIEVQNMRLADFYRLQGVKTVDFLKIDAEGYDFDALESHDFTVMQPRLILIEYGTHFPRQTLASINQVIARMADAGYGAITFNYTDDGNFKKGKWIYRLVDIFVDCSIPQERSGAFGNIVFYRAEDKDFLLTLYALLDSCRPRSEAWRNH
jgi:FkbM family methyltransferase